MARCGLSNSKGGGSLRWTPCGGVHGVCLKTVGHRPTTLTNKMEQTWQLARPFPTILSSSIQHPASLEAQPQKTRTNSMSIATSCHCILMLHGHSFYKRAYNSAWPMIHPKIKPVKLINPNHINRLLHQQIFRYLLPKIPIGQRCHVARPRLVSFLPSGFGIQRKSSSKASADATTTSQLQPLYSTTAYDHSILRPRDLHGHFSTGVVAPIHDCWSTSPNGWFVICKSRQCWRGRISEFFNSSQIRICEQPHTRRALGTTQDLSGLSVYNYLK